MTFASILIGSTALGALALGISLTLYRSGPADRYGFLLSCLVALIVLPPAIAAAAEIGFTTIAISIPGVDFPSLQHANAAPSQIAWQPAYDSSDEKHYLPASRRALAASSVPQSRPTVGEPIRQDRFADPSPAASIAKLPPNLRLRGLKTHRDSQGQARNVSSLPSPVASLLLVYLVGFLGSSMRFAFAWIKLSRSKREATLELGAELTGAVESARKKIGVRQFPPVFLSHNVETPLAFGAMRPVILLPHSLTAAASATEIEAILLHEYAHIDQRHGTSVWLSAIAKTLYWFNPLVHWAAFELCRAREEISDNFVLSLIPATQLARTLLQVATARGRVVPQVAAAGLLLPRWSLEQRVAGLLNPSRKRETHVTRFHMTVFNLMAATLCATLAGVQIVQAQTHNHDPKKDRHMKLYTATAPPPAIEPRTRNDKVDSLKIEPGAQVRREPPARIIAPRVPVAALSRVAASVRSALPDPAATPVLAAPQISPQAPPATFTVRGPASGPARAMKAVEPEHAVVALAAAPASPSYFVARQRSGAEDQKREAREEARRAREEARQAESGAQVAEQQAKELRDAAEKAREEVSSKVRTEIKDQMRAMRKQLEAMKADKGSMRKAIEAAREAQREAIRSQVEGAVSKHAAAVRAAVETRLQAELARHMGDAQSLKATLEEARRRAIHEGKEQAAQAIERAIRELSK